MGAYEKFFRISPTNKPVGLTAQMLDYYGNCGCDTSIVKLAISDDGEINKAFETLLKDLHSGTLQPDQISLPYYTATSSKLMEAVKDGLGGDIFPTDDIRNNLKAYFAENVFAFSAAKTLAMRQMFMGYLTDDDGNLRSFAQFRNSVANNATIYNMGHLQTEYDSAIAHSQMAVKWHTMQSFDKLEYSTVGDNRVRPAHRRFDGLVLNKDDPFWKTYWPPLDWNCRCTIIPAESGAVDSSEDRIKGAKNPENPKDAIKKYFKGNAGIDKVIFKDDHPYFIGNKGKLKELDAMENYNLPSVKKIYEFDNLPSYKPLNSNIEANEWWFNRKSFEIESVDGLKITLDEEFRKKIISITKRFDILHLIDDILKKPDEVWFNRNLKQGGELQNTYIKYYDKHPIVVGLETKNGTVRANTLHTLTLPDGKINLTAALNKRKGNLIYLK